MAGFKAASPSTISFDEQSCVTEFIPLTRVGEVRPVPSALGALPE
jgi:hypothetical protein